ncbi:alpha/beta hydrolase fold protein-3 domain protein [Catenulispora acidiphila DSM 44928]|uniref:Alpha/beta hydrolase fold protein-3 domain protein n=1 Tax=Catenulispora acidiphila (strain DSM 44928 / JCM 14897 / NBRC 102108 / NRRL B-24433 / ID139908) TaxID=479433 RepID=C7Q541_CATAD|nr:alpha/beta hydrolase [Catenulispora acidiphila]ACU73989.1 alpha/beta hydrolase fold protein-3 domain protein [Catenulispora acidiphila DSM 44928]
MSTLVHEGLTYAEIQGYRPLLLDLHLPVTASPQSPVPVVVWMHGGAFWEGDRRYLPSNLAPNAVFDTLVASGIAAATIDYRLSGEATYPAQLHDVRAAIRYLRSNAATWGLDATRVGVWGESSGGTLGALAALAPTDSDATSATNATNATNATDQPITAAALWCSPTDLVSLRHFSAISGLLGGGDPEALEAAAVQASPLTHVRGDAPAFLIMHGDADRTVPVHQAELLHKALLAVGARSTFTAVEGAGHVFDGHPDAQQLVEQVVAFFAQEFAQPAAA